MSTLRNGQLELERLASRLSERDWAIVRMLQQHRYATTSQLRRRFFAAHASQSAATRACVRVLGRLHILRVLTRLERRVGGVRHGSGAFVWCLDVLGDRLTRQDNDANRKFHEPSSAFLGHALAVTEAHIQLVEAAHCGAFRLNTVLVETEAWRDYLTPGGVKGILKPDLMVTTSGEDYEDHWYVEIDLGTESVQVLLRKCRAYEEYRRTGRAQAEHGVFPRVLWILPSKTRVERLRAAIANEPRLPDRLFRCITRDELIETMRSPP